jgi:hypothetical protein
MDISVKIEVLRKKFVIVTYDEKGKILDAMIIDSSFQDVITPSFPTEYE